MIRNKSLKLWAAVLFLLLCLDFQVTAQTARPGAISCREARGGSAIPALPSGPAGPGELRFAAIGDTGTGCDRRDEDSRLICQMSEALAKTQAAAKFDLLWLLGDNVYESGSVEDMPEKFYAPFDPLSQQGVLIKGVVGNHDVRSFEGANLQMKFFQAASAADQRKFFTEPLSRHSSFPEPASRYYTFSLAPADAEFFALDSSIIVNDCCGPSFWKRKFTDEERSAHIEWLVRTIAASKARWKIVVLHHPLYSSALEHGVRIRDGREEMDRRMKLLREPWPEEGPLKGRSVESLLIDSGVKLVLAGHDHVYERITPRSGVRHFVSGAGAKLRPDNFDAVLPSFHECGESRIGSFMLFSLTPERIEFWAVGQDGQAFDHGVIR